MEVGLLGPVEIRANGQTQLAGPPQQRLVLAAIAVDVPRPVPISTVVDRIWPDDPPNSARTAVAARVNHLRHLFAGLTTTQNTHPGPADPPPGPCSTDRQARAARRSTGPDQRWLASRRDGYQLRLDPDAVDVLRFQRLVRSAAQGERSDAERVRLLDEALALWRGPALDQLTGDWAGGMRTRWESEKIGAVLQWAWAMLRLGQPASVIPVVSDLAEQHQHEEPLAVVLVRALAAAGRRSEALTACKTASERLSRELGVDPGAALLGVQQALLADQPPPALPPPPKPMASPAAVPAQVPGSPPGFVGRVEHLARLDTLLATAATDAPTSVVITALSGTAGVGKTALAVHWAHRVRNRFPDGQLYVNLRGFHQGGPVMDPATAVRGFLEVLGIPNGRIPTDPDAQVALYRSLLDGKRTLVVIDNARDADHARPLLPATPTAFTVVTSRNQLTDLVAADGAYPLTLDLLTEAESRELLERLLGTHRTAAEPAAVERIVGLCARLPLALALVAARAATHPTFPLDAVAAELTNTAREPRRDASDDVTGRVRAVFSWSYTTLTPPAARLFRLLGLHPGPDASAPAAASLTGQPPTQVRPLLAELVRAGLLSEHLPGRYAFHDLLRAYATHLTHTTDTDQERKAVMMRLLDHYTRTAHTADQHLNPTQDPTPVPLTPPAPGSTPEHPTDHNAALDWLDAERPVLLSLQHLAATTGWDTQAWHLAWGLHTVLARRGAWHELAGAWQAALPAARRLPHPAAAAAHRLLGQAVSILGALEQAHTHLQHALHLYTATMDPVGQARTHGAIAYLWQRRSRPDRALYHAQRALSFYETTGHRRGQAHMLNYIAWYHVLLDDPTQALISCERALTLFQQVGDRDGEAATWDSLGYAHHHLTRHAQAVDCYQHAVSLFRDVDDRYRQAESLTRLGDTHAAAGEADHARTAWTTALTILTDLNHPDADTVRTKLATVDRTDIPVATP